MPIFEQVLAKVSDTREAFEKGMIPRAVLAKLYIAYNPDVEIESFLDFAAKLFPSLNCGLASIYLRHQLQDGEVVNGSYEGQGHTFLALGDLAIIDITADQFGGPAVYVGPLVEPWSLIRPEVQVALPRFG